MSFFIFFVLCLFLLASLSVGLYGFSTPLLQAALIFLYVIFGGDFLGWNTFFVVLLSALAAEGVEFISGYRGASKQGGSRRGTLGALIGGFAGAIAGSPFFPLGPILGSFLGTYAGCILFEITASKNFSRAHTVSLSATLSKIAGFAFKIAVSIGIIIGVAMVGLLHLFKSAG